MSRWNLAWLVGIPAVAVVALTVVYTAPSRDKDQNYEIVRLLVETLDEVQQNYVRELDAEARRKLVEDMINGGLERLDPHSSYMNPKEYKHFNTQSRGKFGGIGIQIHADRRTGYLQVVSPMVGTPAYEAGVLAGDLVMKIEGKSTENMSIDKAVELIQGEPGQKIVLTVLHEGAKEPVDIEMARAIIEVPSVMGDLRKPDNPREWDYLIDKDNKIGYIRLLVFNENSVEELKSAIEQLRREGMQALVLDLRHNPGGQLSAAVEVANLFITEGRIVSTRGRNEKERIFDAAASHAILAGDQVPMAVLINRYSASASEIVSAALQDHQRAVIIGERTYGKGSVQNILKIENDLAALKLTTSSYWRPSGKNIHRFPDSKESDDWGVLPNPGFEVKLSDEERVDYAVYRRDRDIVLGKGANPPPKPKVETDDQPKKPFVDRVLEKATEHLRAEIAKKK